MGFVELDKAGAQVPILCRVPRCRRTLAHLMVIKSDVSVPPSEQTAARFGGILEFQQVERF